MSSEHLGKKKKKKKGGIEYRQQNFRSLIQPYLNYQLVQSKSVLAIVGYPSDQLESSDANDDLHGRSTNCFSGRSFNNCTQNHSGIESILNITG